MMMTESILIQVAWTRLTDEALLTAGGQSFTSDTRFQISPKREARDWVLNIRWAEGLSRFTLFCRKI